MSKPADHARLEELRGQVRKLLEVIQANRESLTIGDTTRNIKACLQFEEIIAKLTGEGAEITDAKLLRSATWDRMQRRIARALEPWPEAMKAVGEALQAEDD